MPALVSSPWNFFRSADHKGPLSQHINLHPSCNFPQSSSVMTQMPGTRSANMVRRTSPRWCFEDQQPCFIHARQNARPDDATAVDRYGKLLLHLVFTKKSHSSPRACSMSLSCSSAFWGYCLSCTWLATRQWSPTCEIPRPLATCFIAGVLTDSHARARESFGHE